MLNCGTVYCIVTGVTFKWLKEVEIRDKVDQYIFKVKSSVSFGPFQANLLSQTRFEMPRNLGFIIDFPEYDQPEPEQEKIISIPGLF